MIEQKSIYDRVECTPENPFNPKDWPIGQHVLHPSAEEINDLNTARRMRCPDCGTQWIEELPE